MLLSSTPTVMLPFKKVSFSNRFLIKERIDVWKFSLQTDFKNAHFLLDSDERERANRFYFSHHQRRFTIAHAILRLILSQYVGQHPKELEFTYNAHGKPQLRYNASLQFNLSHSHEMALLAVGKDYPLGVDLEFFSDRPYVGIGGHIFSPLENHQLQALSPGLKPLGFFHTWVQKEAMIKACGLGLSYPTKQVDVAVLPPARKNIEDHLHQKTWQMVSFMPQIACCAALCYTPAVKDIHFFTLDNEAYDNF